MWHLSEAFRDKKVVAKIMVSVPQKFAKSHNSESASFMHESKGFQEKIIKLVKVPFKQRQGKAFLKIQSFYNDRGKMKVLQERVIFPLVPIANEQITETGCYFKDKPLFHCDFLRRKKN